MASLNKSLDSLGRSQAGCCFLLAVAVTLLKNRILCCDICFSPDACQKIKQLCAGQLCRWGAEMLQAVG